VLVATGWDEHWGTPTYLSDNPFLTAAAAERLVEAGAALIGIDSLNDDSPTRRAPPTPPSSAPGSRWSST
jgi:kynurenine formamidase